MNLSKFLRNSKFIKKLKSDILIYGRSEAVKRNYQDIISYREYFFVETICKFAGVENIYSWNCDFYQAKKIMPKTSPMAVAELDEYFANNSVFNKFKEDNKILSDASCIRIHYESLAEFLTLMKRKKISELLGFDKPRSFSSYVSSIESKKDTGELKFDIACDLAHKDKISFVMDNIRVMGA